MAWHCDNELTLVALACRHCLFAWVMVEAARRDLGCAYRYVLSLQRWRPIVAARRHGGRRQEDVEGKTIIKGACWLRDRGRNCGRISHHPSLQPHTSTPSTPREERWARRPPHAGADIALGSAFLSAPPATPST